MQRVAELLLIGFRHKGFIALKLTLHFRWSYRTL